LRADDHGGTATALALPRPDIDAAALLTAWEKGCEQPPARRAVSLLVAAWPGVAPEPWLHASVGQRDAGLLTLREALFGRQLEGVAECPSCRTQLEVGLRTDDVRMPRPRGEDTVRVEACGWRVECRLPTSADLIEVVEQAPDDACTALLGRCVEVAHMGDVVVDAATLPATVAEVLVQAMAEADPQADVHLSLRCAECDHRWSSPFDILSYLWEEVDEWARRLLREIHALASAYGWSERDVLGMSARRRSIYLEMAGGSA
jgi:hypothetical protein